MKDQEVSELMNILLIDDSDLKSMSDAEKIPSNLYIETYEILITLEFIPENYVQIEELVGNILDYSSWKEKTEFSEYLKNSKIDKTDFWRPYFINIFKNGYTLDGEFSKQGIYDSLKKSVELGNPYALVDLDRTCKNDHNKLEDFGEAFKLGCPYGIISQINTYFEVDRILLSESDPGYGEENKLNQKQKEELRQRVFKDLEKVKQYKSRYILGEITQIYYDLVLLLNKREDKITRDNFERRTKKMSNNYRYILEIAKLKAELKQVKRSYEELKAMKKMDFNDILGKEVGDFL